MQLDISPMPAAGDLPMADPPPGNSLPGDQVVADGTATTGPEPGNSRKGFRETMDALLRVSAPGDTDEVPSSAPDATGGEASGQPELALPEAAVLAQPPPQEEARALSKLTLISETTDIALPQGSKAGEAATPAPQTDRPVLARTSISSPPIPEYQRPAVSPGTVENSTPELVVKPTNAAADLSAAAAGKETPNPVATKAAAAQVVAADPDGTRATDIKPLLPTASGQRSGEPGADPSTLKAGSEARSAVIPDSAFRPAQAQRTPDQQTAPLPETGAPVQKPAAVNGDLSQTVANLAEGGEKAGGEGKPLIGPADVQLDTNVATGSKNATSSQSEAVTGAKTSSAPSPAPTMNREEVIQQIVSSAKLRVSNGQQEMRIQLKPEHLGQVRLSISTDQQQVVVKVMAELPVVKELLETNLPQLRSELQGQGLEIDKFEVSVGGDSETQNKQQQTWGQRRGGPRNNSFAQADPDQQEEPEASNPRRQPEMDKPSGGVDYFV